MSTTLEGAPGAGPQKAARPVDFSAAILARRRLADRLAGRVVVLGGMTIIASILAILVVIAWQVVPLFRPPAALALSAARPEIPAPPLAAGVDEYREIAWILDAGGMVRFIRLGRGAAGPAPDPVPVPGLDGSTPLSVSAGAVPAAGTPDGRVVPFAVVYDVSYGDGRRHLAPRLEPRAPLLVDPEGRRPVAAAAYVETPAGPVAAARLDRDIVLLAVRERRGLVGGGAREETRLALPGGFRGEARLLALDGRADDLFVGTSLGQVARYDLRDPAAPRLAEVVDAARRPGAPITALGFLLGDRTLVVGDGAGGVSTWQLVRGSGGAAVRLARVHRFEPHAGAVAAFAASRRDKGFLTAGADGAVRLHYGTSGETLLEVRPETGPPAAVVYGPKADGLLALDAAGAVAHWELRNPHPEITFKTLFGKVWYEGYERPEYVWQSTGGTDDFEAKFSLTPLIFGTLKGTLYALLFAVPLALLGAMYASQFMHPGLKGVLKPTVEIMAALPSVVLGFVAGLWLAPHVERVVPGLLALPLVAGGVLLLASWSWRRLPAGVRGRVRPGNEVFVMIPLVVLSCWAAFELGGVIERVLLAGDYRHWLREALGLTYDQRNSLVVGIAMGFAVIPIIFTIAEDSLANVPTHLTAGSLALGATRWQTALRIVLPTASPGIFSAVMIGFGRAVGETMIVLMATGNTPVMDWSIFNGFRALSANIAVELPEAPEGGTLFRILFLAALLLFALTFLVNTAAEVVRLKLRQRFRYL